jgi:hypothetical protein
MLGRNRSAALAVIGWLAAGGIAWAAPDPLEGDIRDLSIATAVADLPTAGYVDLACAADGTALQGWIDYAHCPADADGLHEVTFAYDEEANPWAALSDKWEGTKIAGHPVVPSLLIADDGMVEAIRIVTDPSARMYLKKKAFLLPIRIMGRYGRDGWECVDREPADGRQPIGGMFIDRHCEKTYFDRHLIMENRLYRTAEQEGQAFTGATELLIRAAHGDRS